MLDVWVMQNGCLVGVLKMADRCRVRASDGFIVGGSLVFKGELQCKMTQKGGKEGPKIRLSSLIVF